MTKHFFTLIFIFHISFSLLADEAESYSYLDLKPSSSLAGTEGLVSSIVDGCVSAITGEFIDCEVDLVVPGPEPLMLQRCYSSRDLVPIRDLSKNDLYQGWSVSFVSTLNLAQEAPTDKERKCHVSLTVPSGATALYKRKFMKGRGDDWKDYNLELTKGFTNCGGGRICTASNLKNNHLEININLMKAKLKAGDGTERVYRYFKDVGTPTHIFKMVEETKLNQTLKQLKHNSRGIFESIEARDSLSKKLYGWIDFNNNYRKEDRSIHVSSSNDGDITYLFRPNKVSSFRDYYLHHVANPKRPFIDYDYTPSNKDDKFLLLSEKRYTHGGPYKRIEYYKKGINYGGHEIRHHSDERIDRVKALKRPVGHDDTPITTYRFNYKIFDKHEKDYKGEKFGEGAGMTEVFDAYNRRSVYHYNSDHRLNRVDHFTGTAPTYYKPYSFEEYRWGEKDTDHEGNLVALWHGDASIGKVHKARFFEYDNKGNITEDCQYGTVTAWDKPDVTIRNYTLIETGADRYAKRYTYSNDDWNLLFTETEDNGKSTSYAYHPNSNAIAAKFVEDKAKNIIYREFNTYDHHLFLTKKIVDDGATVDPENLSGVTVRKITYFEPRTKTPHGFPARIIDKYLDQSTREEVQLRRIDCDFNQDGFPTLQTHYDSNDNYCYTLSWAYDNHNNVIQEIDPLGQVTIREFDPNDHKTKEIAPSGNYIIYLYDKAGRLFKQEEHHSHGVFATSYRYDYIGNLVSKVDPLGNETAYVYDDLNRLIKVTHPLLETVEGAIAPFEQYSYDSLGNRTSTIDALGRETKTIYNIHGKPLLVIQPDGASEKYEYTPDGQLYKAIDKAGTCTRYSRDCHGRILKEEVISPQGEVLAQKENHYQGQFLACIIDEEGCPAHYRYDGAGRLIEEARGDLKTTYTYDNLGRKNSVTRQCGEHAHTTHWQYDLLNRVVYEETQDEAKNVRTFALYTYDALGNKTVVQEGNQYTYFTYDTQGQLIQTVNTDNQKSWTEYDYGHRNALGQAVLKVTVTDPKGQKAVEIKDAFGRPRTLQKIDPFGLLLSQSDITYDAASNMRRQQEDVIVNGEISSTIHHLYEYDSVNQLIKQIEAAATPEQRVTYYVYNSAGQLSALVKPNGIQLLTEYDGKGRISRYRSSDNTISYQYQYNRRDQVTQVDDLINNTQLVRSYDSYGRLSCEKLNSGLWICYLYDAFDRPIQVRLPDNTTIEYEYDAHHLKNVKRGDLTHRYQFYDLYGNLLHSTCANGMEHMKTYDALNRLTEQHLPSYHQSIAYDVISNVTGVSIIDPLGTYQNEFSYNGLYQLVSEEGLEEHTYSYDSLHNRIVKDQESCPVNAINQILAQGSAQFRYDTNGNLVHKIEDGIETSYGYDALDRLITSTTGGITTTYTYDAFNRRLSKNDQLFIYSGENEIGSFRQGKIEELRILGVGYGAEIGASVLFELHGQTLVPIHDHNGNVAALFDLNGNPVETYRYTGFGIETTPESTLNPWRYASKRFDPETGFIYFGRRYYDPSIGRWITTDPEGYQDGPNLYAYVHNSPLSNFDLYGLFSFFGTGSDITHFYGYEDIFIDRESIPDEVYQLLTSHNYELPQFYDRSKRFNLSEFGCPELPKNMRIGFLNGIKNEYMEDVLKSTKALSELSGGYNIHGVYNATHGFLWDGFESILNLMNIGTTPVSLVHKQWDNFFANSSPDAKFLQICHSQGAILIRDALRDYPPELRKRILVIAIAPAAYIDPETCAKVIHYRAPWYRDPVPRLDFLGERMAKGRIVTLDSHCLAPMHDHSFLSPTYKNPLKNHIEKYIATGGKDI